MTFNFIQIKGAFLIAFLAFTLSSYSQDDCLIRTAIEPSVENRTFQAVYAENVGLEGMIPWTNPDFVTSLNGETSTLSLAPGERSDRLLLNDFFFDIPLGARIAGIQLEFTGASSNFDDLDEKQVQFLLDGSPFGNNLANKSVISEPWQVDQHTWNYGYEFSDWGMDPTYNLLNDNGLDFVIQIENDSNSDSLNISLDNANITVYYVPLTTLCGPECITAYNDEVNNVLSYNWTLNNGIGVHDIDTLDRVNNLDFSEADFGIIDIELEIITTTDTFYCTREFLRENCGPTTLGDFVWFDENLNGLQDEDEVGISGIELQLFTPNGELVSTTSTNNAGKYSFDDIESGYYFVSIESGDFVATPIVSNDSLGSDFNENFRTEVFFISRGETKTNIDAGLFDASSIAGTIWSECDGNGIFNEDTDDAFVVGIELGLYRNNILVQSTNTAADGSYLFDNLVAGDFEVRIENEENFSPLSSTNVFNENGSATVSLAVGEDKVDVNGAILQVSSYEFTIFIDENGNGTYQNSENALDGTVVTLRNSSTSFSGTIENGQVSFNGLISMEYFLDISDSEELFVVESDAEVSISNGITLNLGTPDCSSFNEIQAILTDYFTSVGDYVWHDLNGDGLQDDDEPGLEDVTVQLIDVATTEVVMTTTTNANGFYSFESPEPGNYIIVVNPGEGFIETLVDVDSESGSKVESILGQFAMGPFEIVNGYIDDTWDAGFVFSSGLINGLAFLDIDGNNVLSPDDELLDEVEVTLFTLVGPIVQFVESTMTDENGTYEFEAEPGDYYIGFSHPVFNQEVDFQVGNDPLIDSDVMAGGDLETGIFTLAGGGSVEGVNVGYRVQPGNVGNFVFLDSNENGLFDDGESGIPGFSVKAFDMNGDLVNETTTSVIGAYNLSLDPGVYYLEFTKENFENPTIFNPADPDKNSDITNEFGPFTTGLVTVGPGEIIDDIDAGFLSFPTVIGNLVYNDLNANGKEDFGEFGIGGLTVNLIRVGEGIVMTTETGDGTDQNLGTYQFEVTTPGDYYVQFGIVDNGFNYTQYDENGSGPMSPNGFATTPTFTVIIGEEYNNQDAGVVSLQSILGNFVWSDDNGNGIQDEDEPGLNGITVFLYDEAFNFIDVTISSYNVISQKNGYYYFDELEAGEYILVFDTPDNFTIPHNTGNVTIDSDVTSEFVKGSTGIINLLEGEHDFNVDAGIFKLSNEPSDIGDFVWNDENENGIQDEGEAGLEGVTLNLLDFDGAIVQSDKSNAQGFYQFDDVLNGFYRIEVLEPEGWDFTSSNNSFDDETDSDIQSDGRSLLFFVASDQKILTMDVGLVKEDGVLGDTEEHDDSELLSEGDADVNFDNEEEEVGFAKEFIEGFEKETIDVDVKKILELYPNPARERVQLKINVDLANQAKIDLIGSEGQLLKTMYRDNVRGVAHEININTLLPGLYFIRVTDGNEVYFKKLIVQ